MTFITVRYCCVAGQEISTIGQGNNNLPAGHYSRLSRSMIWCRVFGALFIDNVVLYRFAGLFR